MKCNSSQTATKEQPQIVLVADDDASMLDLMREVLEREGFIVLTATSPREAIESLHTNDISLLLLDWVFKQPTADRLAGVGQNIETGEIVLLECQKKDCWLPVIVMSGYNAIDVRSQAILNGALSFEPKPFIPDVLVKHIKVFIRRVGAAKNYFNVSSVDDIMPLDQVVHQYVQSVVDVCGGNVSEAAERLGKHRQTVTKILGTEGSEDSKQGSEN